MKTAQQWSTFVASNTAVMYNPMFAHSIIESICQDMHTLTQQMLEDINVEYKEHAPYGLYTRVEEYVEVRVKDA